MMALEFINRESGIEPDIAENVQFSGVIDCIHKVIIEKDAFTGHNVALLTGGHDPEQFGEARRASNGGGPITIGEGVWIGSFAIILGPCTIGKHAVIAAGSVVTHDVPEYALIAGNPGVLKKIYNHGT